MAKTIFAASSIGATTPVAVTGGTVFSVTISATGTAQLQINLDGDWVGIRTADTASVALATVLQLPPRPEGPYLMRWNVTANSGTVTVYIA
jgi:hypothetical protein